MRTLFKALTITLATAALMTASFFPVLAAGGDDHLQSAHGSSGQMPKGHPPIAATGEPSVDGLTFKLPQGWQPEAPSSAMRKYQASIPGEAGKGDFLIFFFGVGGGGGTEANLDRWVHQVEAEKGAEPQRGTFEANGLKVSWVETLGTQKASPMMGPPTDVPGTRLLGAVVEGPGGPWFFKATGPDKTMSAQREAFMGMLKSAKVAK